MTESLVQRIGNKNLIFFSIYTAARMERLFRLQPSVDGVLQKHEGNLSSTSKPHTEIHNFAVTQNVAQKSARSDAKKRALVTLKKRASISAKKRASIFEKKRASISEKKRASISAKRRARISCADYTAAAKLSHKVYVNYFNATLSPADRSDSVTLLLQLTYARFHRLQLIAEHWKGIEYLNLIQSLHTGKC